MGIVPEAVFEFLWYAPDVPEKELSDLPLVCACPLVPAGE